MEAQLHCSFAEGQNHANLSWSDLLRLCLSKSDGYKKLKSSKWARGRLGMFPGLERLIFFESFFLAAGDKN